VTAVVVTLERAWAKLLCVAAHGTGVALAALVAVLAVLAVAPVPAVQALS